MVDIFERQIELVFVMLGVAAIFRAAIGQHAAEPYLAGIIERHDAIVEGDQAAVIGVLRS